jgi:hypothetical protein
LELVPSSCISIRHYTLTKRTQKWEKEHFDPDRRGAKKKLFRKKSTGKTEKMTKRIG